LSLKTRFLLLATGLLVVASLSVWLVSGWVAQQVIEQWGVRVARIQVRYDSARLLRPLEREIALARQMANSHVLRRWAHAPDDPRLKTQAVEEMEAYRLNFQDKSYFVALKNTGAYFHNNAQNEYAGRQLRYRLDPHKSDDAWFFRLVEEGRDFHLNVNPDQVLGVTKLWIDVLLRDGDEILGVVGTGMDLKTFLKEVVDIGQPGVTSMFVDHNGAIQLYRDERLIDFASLVKPEGQKNTLALLLNNPADRLTVEQTMVRLREQGGATGEVATGFVEVHGHRHLIGMAYLPAIGWYEVTLIDLHVLMPVTQFAPVALVFVFFLLVSLWLFLNALRRQVLSPLAALEQAMIQLRNGAWTQPPLPKAAGEVGKLVRHFEGMALAIKQNRQELEDKVQQRTQALEQLARVDPLTGLGNRRGMTEALAEENERARRQQHVYGLIWLDIDDFKSINDRYGHATGDQALKEVSRLLRSSTRPYDHLARWGGDEFLVMLAPCDRDTLLQTAERIRLAVETQAQQMGPRLAVSVGACLGQPGEDTEWVLQKADQALYRAKAAGRNQVVMA
jgi:diguanylate cyclase (GGDEF)-like protein